jgi:hypothetical protein
MSRRKHDTHAEVIHRLARDDTFTTGLVRAMRMAETFNEMAQARKSRKPPKRTAPELMF